MKPIRIFQHHEWVGPGRLLETLQRRNIPFEVVAPDQASPAIPMRLDDVSGLVFLGADYSVNDPFPWIEKELRLVQDAVEQDLPVLGKCFGGQLISKALGGSVRPMSQWEIGWHEITVGDSPEAVEWMGRPGRDTRVLFWHKECLSIPENTTTLMGTAFQPGQAFVRGATLALGPHFEATPSILRGWVQRYGPTLPPPSATVQDGATILENIETKARLMHQLSERLYDKWLAHVTERA